MDDEEDEYIEVKTTASEDKPYFEVNRIDQLRSLFTTKMDPCNVLCN